MRRLHLGLTCALFVVSSLTLAACGGHTVVPVAAPNAGAFSRFTLISADDATIPNIAGTYAGSIVETVDGKSATGHASFDLKQSGSKISGTVTITYNGKSHTLNLSGTAAKTSKGVALKFTVFDSNGRNASAHGRVGGKQFNGKAYVPPDGSKPAVYITFKTTKA